MFCRRLPALEKGPAEEKKNSKQKWLRKNGCDVCCAALFLLPQPEKIPNPLGLIRTEGAISRRCGLPN
jgi:hypothetical protein